MMIQLFKPLQTSNLEHLPKVDFQLKAIYSYDLNKFIKATSIETFVFVHGSISFIMSLEASYLSDVIEDDREGYYVLQLESGEFRIVRGILFEK